MDSTLDTAYIELAIEKYGKIKSMVSKGRRPTKVEKELISLIFNKLVDHYYYWAEAKAKAQAEKNISKDANRAEKEYVSEIPKKSRKMMGDLELHIVQD